MQQPRKAPNKGHATGKSSRLAQNLIQPAIATPLPDPVPGSGPSSTNKPTIAHASLRQYLFEDVLFSSLGDTLLLCVFESHPTFSIYRLMAPLAKLLLIGKANLLELNLSLSHHPRRHDLVSGLLDRSTFEHLLLGNGNERVGFQLTDAPSTPAFTVTWKELFLGFRTIQLWGFAPPLVAIL